MRFAKYKLLSGLGLNVTTCKSPLQPGLQLLPLAGVTRGKWHWLAALCFAPTRQIAEAASALGIPIAVPEESGY